MQCGAGKESLFWRKIQIDTLHQALVRDRKDKQPASRKKIHNIARYIQTMQVEHQEQEVSQADSSSQQQQQPPSSQPAVQQQQQQGGESTPSSTPASGAATGAQEESMQQSQNGAVPSVYQQPSSQAGPAGDASFGDASAEDSGSHEQPSHDGIYSSPVTGAPGNGYTTTLSGDPLMVIDKSKIPRPYKCPFPNCDKAFYRLEQ